MSRKKEIKSACSKILVLTTEKLIFFVDKNSKFILVNNLIIFFDIFQVHLKTKSFPTRVVYMQKTHSPTSPIS